MSKFLYAIIINAVIILSVLLLVLFNYTNIIIDHTEAEPAFCGVSDAESEGRPPMTDKQASGKKLFNSNCTPCHAVTEKIVGPALKGVSEKYDEKWLISFIRNSQKMVKEKDFRAVKIFEEYNQQLMVSYEQMSDEEIRDILAYIEYEAK